MSETPEVNMAELLGDAPEGEMTLESMEQSLDFGSVINLPKREVRVDPEVLAFMNSVEPRQEEADLEYAPIVEARPSTDAERLAAANAEIARLTSKLGAQGSKQGDMRERMEAAESALARLSNPQANTPSPTNGYEMAIAAAKEVGKELNMEGAEGELYATMGDQLMGYTKLLSADLKPMFEALTGRLAALESGKATSGIPTEFVSELLEENPELNDLSDSKRAAMVRRQWEKSGRASEPKPAPRAARRDPSTHVSAGGAASSPGQGRTSFEDAFTAGLADARTEADMKKLENILDFAFDGATIKDLQKR